MLRHRGGSRVDPRPGPPRRWRRALSILRSDRTPAAPSARRGVSAGFSHFRPTHGRLSLEGVMPFAASLDAVGWFARDGALLERVGHVLLVHAENSCGPEADQPVGGHRCLRRRRPRDSFGPHAGSRSPRRPIRHHQECRDGRRRGSRKWSKLIAVFREREGWDTHRDWIERCNPRLPGAERHAHEARSERQR